MKTFLTILSFILIFTGCYFLIGLSVDKSEIRTKKTETLDVMSLRVDDESEYHLTALSSMSGQVESWHDLRSNVLDISFCDCSEPKAYIEVNSSNKGTFTRNTVGRDSFIIKLPRNFKINYFDD